MPLTPLQIQQLKVKPAIQIVRYIDEGHVRYPADLDAIPGFDPTKRAEIDRIIANRPNGTEKEEWEAIMPILGQNDEVLRQRLQTYITNWQVLLPSGNHVAEARQKLNAMDQAEQDRIAQAQAEEAARRKQMEEALREQQRQAEEADWLALDQQNASALTAHLETYPNTVHKVEIEEALWRLAKSSSNPMASIQRFIELFPDSSHVSTAIGIMRNYGEWQEVEDSGDLVSIREYIICHPGSPLIELARQRFEEKKDDEVRSMMKLQSAYPIESLFYYIKQGIFTEEELKDRGVATDESLEILGRLDKIKEALPDVNVEISKCTKDLAKGYTDVFLFGIPSTGKTCLLMGLIGSNRLNVNTVRSGGPYACALQQYLESGFTIGQTPKDFVATIEAEIPDEGGKHKLNLVEMAGEDFAFKIADNPDGKVSFEDIGAGATEILCNNNHKVFFIIVDPTARTVAFNHIFEEEQPDGTKRSYLQQKSVNQGVILKRMVDLLCLPENSKILDKVDFIHIIVTKADTFGDGPQREEKAVAKFMEQHRNILQPLTELCRAHGINESNKEEENGVPKLFTFSLGSFYVGGIYKYNDADANKLANVLKNHTEIIADKTSIWRRVQKLFN